MLQFPASHFKIMQIAFRQFQILFHLFLRPGRKNITIFIAIMKFMLSEADKKNTTGACEILRISPHQ